MRPFVQQIIQCLELLAEQALRQVLEIISLLVSLVSITPQDAATKQQVGYSIDLKSLGNIWIVSESQVSSQLDWENCINKDREERIDKLAKW